MPRVSILFLSAYCNFVKLVFYGGVVVGSYFYTVGGYTTFNVPDDFSFATKGSNLTRAKVTSSSMLISSSRHFLYRG